MYASSVLRLVLPIFLFTASTLANSHASCTCHNGDSYNWRITTLACTQYNGDNYNNGAVVYDTPSGRCTQATTSDSLGGNEWEAACKAIAVSGFQCASGGGTCYANADDVRGWC